MICISFQNPNPKAKLNQVIILPNKSFLQHVSVSKSLIVGLCLCKFQSQKEKAKHPQVNLHQSQNQVEQYFILTSFQNPNIGHQTVNRILFETSFQCLCKLTKISSVYTFSFLFIYFLVPEGKSREHPASEPTSEPETGKLLIDHKFASIQRILKISNFLLWNVC